MQLLDNSIAIQCNSIPAEFDFFLQRRKSHTNLKRSTTTSNLSDTYRIITVFQNIDNNCILNNHLHFSLFIVFLSNTKLNTFFQ